ncbi:MAG TPA: hypothetical protein VGP46_11030 [Acidimicrobiales bacterium]|nr:hypothetical protein [Acidimicrobiales bacterium]
MADCDLCEAARMTCWYHEDEICWIADCEVCDVPMVVWRSHGAEPAADERQHMLAELERVARERFGAASFKIDGVMRQIPDHFHAHARDEGWWQRRFQR